MCNQMDSDHKRVAAPLTPQTTNPQPGLPAVLPLFPGNMFPPQYQHLLPFIFSHKRIPIYDLKGDCILIYPFNVLLAASSNKYVKLHVLQDGRISEHLYCQTLHDFTDDMPKPMFFHRGRFYAVNIFRLTGFASRRTELRFDEKHQIKLEHKMPVGLEEAMISNNNRPSNGFPGFQQSSL